MKKLALVIALVLMVAPAMYAGSWTGWITDEHCGAKGNNADHKSCAKRKLGDMARPGNGHGLPPGFDPMRANRTSQQS